MHSLFMKVCKENKLCSLWVVWDKAPNLQLLEKYYGVVVTEVVQRKLKRSCQYIYNDRKTQTKMATSN